MRIKTLISHKYLLPLIVINDKTHLAQQSDSMPNVMFNLTSSVYNTAS